MPQKSDFLELAYDKYFYPAELINLVMPTFLTLGPITDMAIVHQARGVDIKSEDGDLTYNLTSKHHLAVMRLVRDLGSPSATLRSVYLT